MGTRSERAADGEAAVAEDQAPPSEPASRRAAGGGGGPGVFIGKHRLAAAIACLDQEILSLQKELTELETMEPSSASCKEWVFQFTHCSILSSLHVCVSVVNAQLCNSFKNNCRVVASTEGKPDPLLPITTGPENSSWDRWFQRVRSSRNKWWAHKASDFS
ncbi:Guanine nucleotide-binding protein subunit gamma 2 [Rhynchospora pubera]|uniref:Guanine nucleotide-binding protein subunit gamma 2 n=1 Tax=Rhynchospora pubera TaxID=906938 RepID=A0AAV8HEK2_9POAL|nr:Guanine nucleotide-binding protein subunit gamma 2 [Rhynchospora pubera]